MSEPVDLVRAALEQAWAVDCQSDIYLARQVVELRGRVVELEVIEQTARAFRARWESEGPGASWALRELFAALDAGDAGVGGPWKYGDLHECPMFRGAHLAGTDCVTYALKHGDQHYRPAGGASS